MPTKTASTTSDLLNPPNSPSGSASSSASSSSSSSSSSSADSAALEVRQRAFDLLNRMGPESDDDVTTWPKQPEIKISSYQHGGVHDNNNNSNSSNNDHNRRREEAAYHVQNDDDHYDYDNNSFLTLGGYAAEKFVQCVSDACKLGASGIVNQNTALAKSGYQTLKSYAIAETQDRFVPSSIERQRGEFENVNVVDYHRSGRYT